MLSNILKVIDEDEFEFDFYIEPHKVRNVQTFTLERDLTIEFSVDLDWEEENTVGGDWDERLHEYIETSREIKNVSVYDSEGDEIELTKREKSVIESAIDDNLHLKLY